MPDLPSPPSPARGAAIYVVAAHPHWTTSRVNGAVLQAVRGADDIVVNDLYASYPDYDIDVELEQARLAAARLVVLQFPVHWYAVPPLLKLWLDEVLTLGWAYGRAGTALHGKDLWLVASTGGPQDAYAAGGYNLRPIDDYLLPLRQVARLCGMRWLPPLVLHGANGVSQARIAQHAAQVGEQLRTWPAWAGSAVFDHAEIPASDRPSALADTAQ
jgi:glutathione-regulated potassium-efflux system ancillary protein KefF